MRHTREFYHQPHEGEQLRTGVVTAIAKAHDGDVITQKRIISDDGNTDALDGLFRERNLKMTLQFEADTTTATVTADPNGNPTIKIESHR